jgi:2-oxoglutarate ferredoxin oxidoreductase subunit gamma
LKKEIIIAGSGGQGISLMSAVIAEAASSRGFHVAETETFGPEARGGSSIGEIILSDREIMYTKVDRADILIAFDQNGLDMYTDRMKAGSIIIYDSSLSLGKTESATYPIPMKSISMKAMNTAFYANMVCLGAIHFFVEEAGIGSLIEAVETRSPSGYLKNNLKSFSEGYRYMRRRGMDSTSLTLYTRKDKNN